MLKLQKIVGIVGVCLLLIAVSPVSTIADWSDDWNIYFFGINYKDFEGRKVLPTVLGAVSGFIVHEAGHLFFGHLGGADTSMKEHDGWVIAWADGYNDMSRSEKGLYHAGGFIAQTIVSVCLTAAPKTRHSDFTVGFNAWSTAESFLYPLRDVPAEDGGDVENLNELGYNGRGIAWTSSVITGTMLYYSLDKD